MVRYAAKRDTAVGEIIVALRAAGALVEHIGLPVDLLCRYRGRLYLLEAKSPGASLTRKDRKAQRDFCALWEVPIVTTPYESLTAIGAIGQ